jgi:hypothetical protein
MKIFRKALVATAVGASLLAAGPAAIAAAPTDLSLFGDPVLKFVSDSSFDDIFSFSVTNAGDVTIGGSSSSISIDLGKLGTFTIPGVSFTGYNFSALNDADYTSKGMKYSTSGNDFTLVAKGLSPGTYLFEVTGIISGSSSTLSALKSGLVSSAYGVVAVESVPEPGEWAMMLAGLGMVGAMIRRRITK